MVANQREIQVVKHSLDGRPPVIYRAETIDAPEGWVAVRARWVHGTVDLSDIVFHDDDLLLEYFSLDHPYNAFAVFRPDGTFGGWYCNVTQPTELREGEIHWHDLLIDVIVDSSGVISVHDEDDVERLGITRTNPELAGLIYRGRDELIDLIRSNAFPFSEVNVEAR